MKKVYTKSEAAVRENGERLTNASDTLRFLGGERIFLTGIVCFSIVLLLRDSSRCPQAQD